MTFKSDCKKGYILIVEGLENIPMYKKENKIICELMDQREILLYISFDGRSFYIMRYGEAILAYT